MANVLTVPQSGSIYFDSSSAGGSTVPNLTAGVSIGYDGCAGLTITSYSSASADRFSVDGESGRLFGVSDNLTGTIFSVNDASGLPIIEVNSDATTDTIAIGEYGTNALFVSAGNVGVGTATPTSTLDVSGDVSISGNLLSGGSDLNSLFISTGTGMDLGSNQTVTGTKNFSGDICLGDQIFHTGDTDTYLQFVGANDFRVVAGARDNLRVKQTEVVVNQASNDVDFRVIGNNDNYALFVEGSTDNVGIGTSSPVGKLTVSEAGGTGLEITPVDADAKVSLTSYDRVDNAYRELNFDGYNYNFRTSGSTPRVSIINNGNVGIGTASPSYKLEVDGTFSSNSLWTDSSANTYWGSGTSAYGILTWNTGYASVKAGPSKDLRLGGNNSSTHMAIDTSGNVGIGTTSPSQKLHVSGNVDIDNGGILLQQGYGINTGISGYDIWMPTTTRIGIQTAATERLSILNNGNVGIGCIAPTQKLAVAGDGLFTSDLTVQGDLTVTGDFTCLETTVSLTSAMDITNTGTGPALVVNQTGSNDIVNFQDDGTSAFYIEDGGNVGIGITNPTAKLHVSGNALVDPTANGVALTVGRYSGQPNIKAGTDDSGYLIMDSSGGLGAINWYVSDNVILANGGGSVGIGDSTPSYKLDVNGTLRSVGQASFNAGIELIGNLNAPDNSKIRLGNSADLQIYHDGVNSYIEDFGTGNLKVRASAFEVLNATNSESMIGATQDAGVCLYYNNSKKIDTTNTGIGVCGDISTTGGGTFSNSVLIDYTGSDTAGRDAGLRVQNDSSDWGIRIAKDSYANFGLRVDSAGANAIAVNCDSSTNTFSVNGSTGSITTAGDLFVCGGDIILGGTGRIQGIDTVSADTDATSKCYVDACLATKLSTTGKAADSNLLDGIDSSSFLRSNTADTASGTINFSGNICVGGNIYHTGTSDTYIALADDQFIFRTGWGEQMRMVGGTTVFNACAANLDFRVSGQSDANALYVDASSSKVGIGVSAPGEKLTVAGNLSASGTGFVDKLGIGAEPSGDEVLTVDGTNGNLFTITDSVTGTVFAVSDSAGLPILEAYTDACDMITMGEYGSNALVVCDTKVGVGTATPNEALTVVGSVSATCFKKAGGTSSQFLKADGSVDSTSYSSCATSTQGTKADNALPAAGGTITGNLAVNGNTCLGNANGDYVHINDQLFVGATDSGNAGFWFGEGTTGDVNYGSFWYWDSGYTHYWCTVNNSTNTKMMSYATNDTSKVQWFRNFEMNSNKVTGLATPTAGTDATNKTYVDNCLATKLNTTGCAADSEKLDGVDGVVLAQSLRAGLNVTGGGDITVNSSFYIKNSSRFIVIAAGKGSNFATSGYFDIDIPTSGTITGVGGASNKTATSNGIPLAQWEALYYILPIGSNNSSQPANFRVVDYTGNVNIPYNWILLAVRNGDGTNNVVSILGGKYILGAGQSISTNTYNSRRIEFADKLTTARTIAGTSFNGSANINISYNNLTNKPTIPTNNSQLSNGCGYTCNTGTVTSVGGGDGLTGTVTTSGNLAVDSTVVRTTGNQNMAGLKCFESGILTNTVTNCSGQQLVLNAGESASYATGQTNEFVYLNAESGLIVNSSPDNWVSGWAGRKTTTINDTNGDSTFSRNIIVGGTVDGVDVAALATCPGLNATGTVCTLSNLGITATAAEINKIDGFTGTVTDLNYAKDLRATGVTTTEFNCLDGLTATTTELNYSDGVTSNIQNQLNAKQASGTYNTIIGTDSDINTSSCTVIDQLNMTDGVITSHTTRTLTNIGATDDRDMKPCSSGIGCSFRAIKPFFSSLEGMTGSAGTNYQDVLVLDTYSDASGGNANALTFDKSAGAYVIKHWNAAQNATSWGTACTIAYTSCIPTNNNQLTNGAGYTTCNGTVSNLGNLGITATAAEINKIDGFTGTVTDLNYAKDLRATGVTTTEFNCLDGLTATTAELNYTDGVTSNIQTQLNAKTTCTGTTTPSNTQTFTNKSGNISQWTNDSGYTTCNGTITNLAGLGVTATAAELNKMDGVTATTAELNYVDGVTSNIQTQLNAKTTCTGTTTPSNTQTFTNKSGNISQWTNDSGYTTCTGTGDITAVTAGNGLTGGASSGAATLNVGAGTAITVAADTVGVTSTCNTAWNAKTTCTGTTTPSNTQTFTNKSGNISQWTNDSGYTTCTGTITNLAGLGVTATAAELNKMDGVTATTAELNYTDGVTSNIQTQLNAKTTCTGNLCGCAAQCIYDGNNNFKIGPNALCSNAGTYNVAIGSEALCNNGGHYNTAIGRWASKNNGAGLGNVAIGALALYSNTSKNYNVAIGYATMRCTTGCGNVAIGERAMCAGPAGATSASNSVAIGKCTLRGATGNSNVAIGAQAGQSMTSGFSNMLFGAIAGFGVTTGSHNVYIGDSASRYNASGANNVAIGKCAGRCTASGTKTSGDNNIYIGTDARAGAANSGNEMVFGNGAQGCGSNTIRMGNTSITAAYVQTSWSTTSDVRDKTCIADLDKGLCFIGDLQPKSYMWRCSRDSEETKGKCAYGFLAQDILALEDEGIIIDDNNPEHLSMKNDYLIPILVKGMQDQQKIIDKLEKRIAALEA